MSLRYTGEATMDEPALRDVERWKDKIEVRLDNRQIFFLFFGSAMVACMLFVLGVIVGKRLESRGRAEAPAIEDPLAALDRFGATGTTAAPAPAPLTFPRALIGGGAGGSKNRETLGAHAEKAARAERAATKLAVTATPTFATTVAPPPALGAPALAPAPAATSNGNNKKLASLPRPVAATPSPTSKPVVTASAPRQASIAPKSVGAGGAAKPATVAAAKSSPSAPAKPNAAGAAPTEKTKGRFLLQLSSFQDKAEADAFARRFASQNAYVVASEVPGKGTWYRVRVGSYVNLQEATAAKSAFEREHSVIAYVAGNGPAR